MYRIFWRKFDDVLLILVGLLLGLSILLVFSDAMLRTIVGYSIFWLQEIVLYLVIWSTMLGASVAVRRSEHIKVEFFIERLPLPAKTALQLATTTIGFIFSVIFSLSGMDLVRNAQASGIASITTLETPLWIPYLILPFVGFFFSLGFLERAIVLWQSLRKGES